MIGAAKKFAMCLEREQHAQRIRSDEQRRQPQAQRLGELRRRGIGFGQHRWNQQRDRRQKQQAGLQAGVVAVVFLYMMLEAAEQKRHTQHEQSVGDDRAGDRGFHQHVLTGPQRRQRDDQLGQISKRGVEQAADRVACFRRDGFRGVAEQRGQRHDGQNGKDKQQRVRFGLECLGGQQDRHQREQPKEPVVADVPEQRVDGLQASPPIEALPLLTVHPISSSVASRAAELHGFGRKAGLNRQGEWQRRPSRSRLRPSAARSATLEALCSAQTHSRTRTA